MVNKKTVNKRLDLILDDDSMKSAIDNFIEYHGWKDSYNKWDVREFLKHLEDEEYSKNYCRFSYYAVKNLFEAMDLDWKLSPKKDLPKRPSDSESKTPVILDSGVKQLVSNIRRKGTDYERFYLCCSTIYGMRRKEMWQISSEDIETDRVYISTAKGGEQREQWMPQTIRPVMHSYDFSQNFRQSDVTIMNDIFDDMLDKAGIDKEERMGFHSIRRGLRTELGKELREVRKSGGAGVLEGDIAKFIRWEQRGMQKILGIYDKSDPLEGDKEMFKIHPFLEYWG